MLSKNSPPCQLIADALLFVNINNIILGGLVNELSAFLMLNLRKINGTFLMLLHV